MPALKINLAHFWINAVGYLAFGFVFAVVFAGPSVDSADPWFWAWLIGWPVIIALVILKWLGIFFALIFTLAIGFSAFAAWREWR